MDHTTHTARQIEDSLTGMVCTTMTLTEGDQRNYYWTMLLLNLFRGEYTQSHNGGGGQGVEDKGWRTNG